VVVEDVFRDSQFSHLAPIFSRYGYVAVQSTPLLSADGKVVGVLSTHFSEPRRFYTFEFERLDRHIQTWRSVFLTARELAPAVLQ
jgi:GAF domain-containing protein